MNFVSVTWTVLSREFLGFPIDIFHTRQETLVRLKQKNLTSNSFEGSFEEILSMEF